MCGKACSGAEGATDTPTGIHLPLQQARVFAGLDIFSFFEKINEVPIQAGIQAAVYLAKGQRPTTDNTEYVHMNQVEKKKTLFLIYYEVPRPNPSFRCRLQLLWQEKALVSVLRETV